MVDGQPINMEKIKTISDLSKIKKKGKTVGLITGVFDILHYEHVQFLSFAKKKVDILIVGIESDSNVKLFKGSNRPIFNFNQRASVLSSLEYVDFVFKIPAIKKKQSNYSEFYKNIIKRIGSNVLILSVANDGFFEEKKRIAEELKMKIISYSKKGKISSSKILSQIVSIN